MLSAIFDLIKLALVGNQAYKTQSKLGEAESKAENLKNQAQESQNHCVGVQKVKEFQEESNNDHNGGRRHYYMELFSLCLQEKLRLLSKK